MFSEDEILLLLEGLDHLTGFISNQLQHTRNTLGAARAVSTHAAQISSIEKEVEKANTDWRINREKIILLQAKLIHLKDGTVAEDVAQALGGANT